MICYLVVNDYNFYLVLINFELWFYVIRFTLYVIMVDFVFLFSYNYPNPCGGYCFCGVAEFSFWEERMSPRTTESITAAERRVAEENRAKAARGEGRVATKKDAEGRPWIVPGVTLLERAPESEEEEE